MDNNNKIITEELKQIVVLMNYDRSKTLIEQSMGGQSMSPGGGPFTSNSSSNGDSTFEWDHDVSMWAEIGLSVAGGILLLTGFGAPAAAVLFGAATALSVVDGLVYFNEDDPYMGTMMLFLAVIPGGELVRGIRNGSKMVKGVSKEAIELMTKITADESGELLLKFQQKAVKEGLNKVEKETFELIKKATANQSKQLTKKAMKNIWKEFQERLSEWTLKGTAKKSFPALVSIMKWTGKTVLKIYGTAVTVDVLWFLMTLPNWVTAKVRDVSSFGTLMDMSYGKLYDFTPKMIQDLYKNIYLYLYNEDGTPNYSKQSEMMKFLSGDITEKDLEGNEYLVGIATEDSEEELRKIGMDILNQDVPVIEKGSFKNRQPVTFGNLLKGKQIIKKGAKGAVVRDIQRMLASITDPDGKPYELGTTGPKNDGVDGDFGPTLESALYAFQIDNDLEEFDGIVGQETATELKKKYDERR
jgi:uncharacterized membrane protein YphA (DoxX/SURF4 family)